MDKAKEGYEAVSSSKFGQVIAKSDTAQAVKSTGNSVSKAASNLWNKSLTEEDRQAIFLIGETVPVGQVIKTVSSVKNISKINNVAAASKTAAIPKLTTIPKTSIPKTAQVQKATAPLKSPIATTAVKTTAAVGGITVAGIASATPSDPNGENNSNIVVGAASIGIGGGLFFAAKTVRNNVSSGSTVKNITKTSQTSSSHSHNSLKNDSTLFFERTNAVTNSSKQEGLTKGKILNYLSKVDSIPKEQLVSDLHSIGLSLKGQSPGGKFMEFIDHNGNVRVKIHPPDKITKYQHIHLYDKFGNSLDSNLSKVSRKDVVSHIKIESKSTVSDSFKMSP